MKFSQQRLHNKVLPLQNLKGIKFLTIKVVGGIKDIKTVETTLKRKWKPTRVIITFLK